MYFRLYKCLYCSHVFAHWHVDEKVTKVANIWQVEYPHKECELCGLRAEETNVLQWDTRVIANSLGYFFQSAIA